MNGMEGDMLFQNVYDENQNDNISLSYILTDVIWMDSFE